MHLEWVNHASFVFRDGEASLICDPWLSGPVFNKGWELMSRSKFRYEDFAGITHIWFSHEHPDHFYPPNLREIPVEYRRNITVLYHETRDKRVLNLCKGLGFKTLEMPLDQPVRLSSRTAVTTGSADLIDSWLAIRCDDKLILNLNDCIFNEPAELDRVRDLVGDAFLLLTQFSYANWVGNPEDTATHKLHAERKRVQIRQQTAVFRPKHLIPFASYVMFAHQENFSFNKEVNQIADIYRFTAEDLGIPTVVLYPGETWEIGSPHDSSAALAQYSEDYRAALARGPVHTSKPVTLEQLRLSFRNFERKTRARNRRIILRLIPDCHAYIRDLDTVINLSFRRGLNVVDWPPEKADIVLSAESLQYCFSYDWGGDTLAVNGRYEVPQGGNPERFFWNFRPSMYNASGHQVGYKFLFGQAAKRLIRTRKLRQAALRLLN